MSAALVQSTCADNCFAIDAASVRSTCFHCSRLRISRFTGSFDSSMNTSTRAHSDIRTTYADTVEHARLFKSTSSVQRYSLRKKAGSTCSRMSAALVHSTCADNCFAIDAAFVRSTCFQCSRLRISRFTGPFDSSMGISTRAHSDIRTIYAEAVEHARLFKSILYLENC
jgi:hypothetical protein